MFRLSIDNLDNAAFTDPGADEDDAPAQDEACRQEVARILRALADKLTNGSEEGGGVYDLNGNRVGEWGL